MSKGSLNYPKQKLQDGGKKRSSVDYGTPEYEKAYSEGRFRDVPNQLDEVVVTADNRTGKNILEEYPYYNQLSAQDKKYFRDISPIGSQIRARARDGEGFNTDKAKSLVQGMLVDMPLASMQAPQSALVEGIEGLRGKEYNLANALNPGNQRLPSQTLGYKDPQGFFQNAANIGLDVVVDPSNIVGGGLAKNALRTATKKTQKVLPKAVNSISNNLKDLEYARKIAKEINYTFPKDIKKIAKSNDLTDKAIKKMVDEENTFARGVSTNWEKIEVENPQILRHLESKGIDWKKNPQEAAEYMGTHSPIDTGYNRVSMDEDAFSRGYDALYTSNSFKTAEGYTYGDGYVMKVKLPTDFSSASRKDWVDKNRLKYKKDKFNQDIKYFSGRKDITKELVPEKSLVNHLDIIKRGDKKELGEWKNKLIRELEEEQKSLEDRDVAVGFISFVQDKIKRLKKINFNKIKVVDRSDILDNKLLKTEMKSKDRLLSRLKQDLKLKPEEYPKLTDELRDKIKPILKRLDKKYPNRNAASEKLRVDEFFKEVKDLDSDVLNDMVENRLKGLNYAHYIHVAKPGEKILDVVDSRRITPENYKHKSRSHVNTYSKGLSAGAFTGISIGAASQTEMQDGGEVPISENGLYDYPEQTVKVPTKDGKITMKGIKYPVLGIANTGEEIMMQPEKEYHFKGATEVLEIPQLQDGGPKKKKTLKIKKPKAKKVKQKVVSKNKKSSKKLTLKKKG